MWRACGWGGNDCGLASMLRHYKGKRRRLHGCREGSRLEAGDGGGHEREDEDGEGEKGAEAAGRVEGNGIVNGRDAEETEAKENNSPDIPDAPVGGAFGRSQSGEEAQGEKEEGDHPRGKPVHARADRAEDVAAVELASWEEI